MLSFQLEKDLTAETSLAFPSLPHKTRGHNHDAGSSGLPACSAKVVLPRHWRRFASRCFL